MSLTNMNPRSGIPFVYPSTIEMFHQLTSANSEAPQGWEHRLQRISTHITPYPRFTYPEGPRISQELETFYEGEQADLDITMCDAFSEPSPAEGNAGSTKRKHIPESTDPAPKRHRTSEPVAASVDTPDEKTTGLEEPVISGGHPAENSRRSTRLKQNVAQKPSMGPNENTQGRATKDRKIDPEVYLVFPGYIDLNDFDSFEDFERVFPPRGEPNYHTRRYECRFPGCGKSHKTSIRSRRHYQKRHLGGQSACKECDQVLFGTDSEENHHFLAHTKGSPGNIFPSSRERSTEWALYTMRKSLRLGYPGCQLMHAGKNTEIFPNYKLLN
ncbi:hypothetical protein F5X96DRAFT_638264 [Biscogniauxia mediterranea]|nr:hypothetical protein F5X96DRAFT_638264 [Biscogniauxia mediterranea]